MKTIVNILFATMLLLTIAGCGKDNYDEPDSTLNGRVVYGGNAIQLRGTGEAVQLQLYQDGYDKKDPISVYVGQDGTFSARLFGGEYKLVTRDNNGPWVNKRDTLFFTLKGTTNIDVEVTPYFTISDEQISVVGNSLNVTCNIRQNVSSAKLERVYLIVSKTQFADEVNNIYRKDVEGVSEGLVNLNVDLTGSNEVAKAKALYGRVGVKTEGVEQAVWSPVVQLK